MAKKINKTQKTTPPRREWETVNQDDDARKKKEKKTRRANAVKQKRYRESMKAQGYRARLTWEKPLEPGWIRAASPVIRESTLHVAKNNLAIKEVLEILSDTFVFECKRQRIPEKTWNPVYRDFLALLKPLQEGE